jgi:hypothetical protein
VFPQAASGKTTFAISRQFHKIPEICSHFLQNVDKWQIVKKS